jgi:NAD(P)-dependent dehydrogenase (short-subunit alcohol dehydrogenase family)
MGAYTEPYAGNGFWKSFTKTWHNKPYSSISPTNPTNSASNKVIFITGGGSGIGKATALAFAQAGAAAIAIFGRRVERLESAANEIRNANPATKVAIGGVNIGDGAAVIAAFTNALVELEASKVDVFVSNAFSMPFQGKLVDTRPEHFRQGLDLNLMGTFNAVQAILPLLTPNATVVDVNSGIGHLGAIPGVPLYAMQKAANIKLFEYLQAEREGLRVFSIQPGVIATEISSVEESQDDGMFFSTPNPCLYQGVLACSLLEVG